MALHETGVNGTVQGVENFDPEGACKRLYDSMKGLGTDENAISEVIGSHNNEQRQELKKHYKTMYGKDLTEDLSSELGGIFGKVIQALLEEPESYLAENVQKAIKGLGTDDCALIGLLCCRTNDEMNTMKAYYKEKFGSDMEADVADDLSGDLKNLMVSLMNAARDESEDIDFDKVKQDAKDLFEAGEAELGTREEVFNAIFNQRSPAHLREMFEAYKELREGKEIEEAIESEFSGHLQQAYLAIVKVMKNIVGFHAERLKDALKGAGTCDDILIQTLVSRSEIDLKDILRFYAAKYESRLIDDVASDTSGDYRNILIKLLGEKPTE